MSIQLDSTTDSADAVTAARGLAKTETVADTNNSDADQTSDETPEQSESSENEADESTDETEETESDEDESEADKDEAKPKKKSGFKRRIDKLNQRLTERERETEYWKAQALKTAPKETSRAEPIPTATESSKPNPDDFGSHTDYVDALTDWKVDQKLKERDSKAIESKARAEFDSSVKAHQARVEDFKKSHDDFDEVLEDVDDVPLSLAVREAILSAENGPELMYELAKNKTEFARICALSPIAAAREFGKFEARINGAPKKEIPTKQKTTKAPPPLKPVGSKASSSGKSPDDMTYQEWKRARESGKI